MHRNCFFDTPSPLDSWNCPRFSFFFYITKIGSILKKCERFFDFCDFHDFHQKCDQIFTLFITFCSLCDRFLGVWGRKNRKNEVGLKITAMGPSNPRNNFGVDSRRINEVMTIFLRVMVFSTV